MASERVVILPTRGFEWLRLLKNGPVDRARSELEAAGFVVSVASSNPVRLVGGTSRSEGPPPVVYSDGFSVFEEEGRFTVSSTSAKGRALDGTSYESLSDAVTALVEGYAQVQLSRGDRTR